MQRRLVRKRNLEIALSEVAPHPDPKAHLEQYTIPAKIAAEILYMAAYVNGDIIGKTVADLGCGTGRLAIGAALLGAKEAIGIDLDKTAVKLAWKSAKELGVRNRTQWVMTPIDALRGDFDTVLQNPPFGVQKRRADRSFLQKSLEIANRIYSLHKGESNEQLLKRLKEHETKIAPVQPSVFLKRFIEKHGGQIRATYAKVMAIPYMFGFHRKRKHEFTVNLYVIERKTRSYEGCGGGHVS